jgi:hypothetical protein
MFQSTLIQLVGDQTVQNLLPVMALRPAQIIQFRSRDKSAAAPRFETAALNFELSVRALAHEPDFGDYQPKISTIELDSASPKIEDVRSAVASRLAEFPQTVVNFTGATKLMSIGAHQAAAAMAVPSLYCDTQEKTFVDGESYNAALKLPSFLETAAKLSVPLLMAAHGKKFQDWKSEKPTEELLSYGRTSFEVRRDHWNECGSFFDALKPFFFRFKGGIPRSQAELKNLAASALPVPPSVNPALKRFLDAAIASGLCRAVGKSYFLACGPEREALERTANLLIGTWLELAILDMLDGHPHLQKALWSVAPKKTKDADFGEMDIVCVDQRRASLRYISCKAFLGGQTLEHLEAVGDRSHRIGGTFAASSLAVFTTFQDQDKIIRNYAKRLRIDPAVGPAQISHEFGAHRNKPAAVDVVDHKSH